MLELIIPKNAIKYILIQRGELQLIGGNLESKLLKRLKIRQKLYKLYENSIILKQLYKLYFYLQIETYFRRSKISYEYTYLMQHEFTIIKPYLPKTVTNILSIGCGVGGLDAILYNYYATKGVHPNIYLVDKTKVSESLYYEYHEEASFYNSLNVCSNLLEINGVDKSCINTIDTDELYKIKGLSFDFVYSVIAWGFHFPVKVYIDKVYKLMTTNSILILDIRHNTEGLEIIKNYFNSYSIIYNHKLYTRVMAYK